MKYGYLKIILPLLILVISFGFHTRSVFAQTGNYDVTVSPVFFDLSAVPGTQVSDKIRIRNNTSSVIPIKLQIESVTGDLNGNITLKQDKNNAAADWIKFNSTTASLKPLEWTDIPFVINIPKDAGYGYYFAISFTQDNQSPFAKNGAVISGAAAVPILLNVKKEGAKADAKITQFAVKDYVSEYLPVDFLVKIENIGNIHVKPVGNIFITDGSNKEVGSILVNQGGGNILPSSARIFNSSWDDGFIVYKPVLDYGKPKLDKKGNPVTQLVINWNKLTSFRIGKYDANLILAFDNGTRDVPLQATISFWVFPYKFVIGLILFLIVVFLILRSVVRSYIRNQVRKIENKDKNL